MGNGGSPPKFGREELPDGAIFLEDDPDAYAEAEGFLMLGASAWIETRQALLRTGAERPIRARCWSETRIWFAPSGGRTVRANPGTTPTVWPTPPGIAPVFYGKPFPAIFDMARQRIRAGVPPTTGDGYGWATRSTPTFSAGASSGFRTALIKNYGFFDGADPSEAIERSGIVPDFILDRP